MWGVVDICDICDIGVRRWGPCQLWVNCCHLPPLTSQSDLAWPSDYFSTTHRPSGREAGAHHCQPVSWLLSVPVRWYCHCVVLTFRWFRKYEMSRCDGSSGSSVSVSTVSSATSSDVEMDESLSSTRPVINTTRTSISNSQVCIATVLPLLSCHSNHGMGEHIFPHKS